MSGRTTSLQQKSFPHGAIGPERLPRQPHSRRRDRHPQGGAPWSAAPVTRETVEAYVRARQADANRLPTFVEGNTQVPADNLTRQEAAERAELLNVSSYDVRLDLTANTETFPTRSRVLFTAATPGSTTFIDFIGPSVQRIELNGVELDPATHFADSRVLLPALEAENELVVEATASYMNTGEGLHRFVDPVDQQVYLYSQFEVADTRRVFPVPPHASVSKAKQRCLWPWRNAPAGHLAERIL